MARIEKYTSNSVVFQLRHNSRESPRPPNNVEIDITRSHLNYSLDCYGGSAIECKQHYKERLSDVYVYGNKQVNTLCQWVITAPSDLNPEQEKAFFQAAHDYCNFLYDSENCIQSIVHYDEGVKDPVTGKIVEGRPHLHYCFIPVVENKKYMKPNRYGNISGAALYQEKCCANDLIDKQHLLRWHDDFQKFLDDRGIKCTVKNGATGRRNLTVEELKSKTKDQIISELVKENQNLKTKIIENEVQPSGWGKEKLWETEF